MGNLIYLYRHIIQIIPFNQTLLLQKFLIENYFFNILFVQLTCHYENCIIKIILEEKQVK